MKLEELYAIINKRKKEMSENSYVSTLIKKGDDAILQKIGEEAIEVVIAAKSQDKQRIIEEVADLYFMTLMMLVSKKIGIGSIFEELDKRKK